MTAMHASTAPEVSVDDYAIAAPASLQQRRSRTLKHGDMFGVFDRNGDILAGEGFAEGVYYRDTRHLSRLELLIGGGRPMLLSSSTRDDNATLTCDL
ncbi:MAG: amylo-alpha-1,6-glucosidase, partial [Acetobacteraceae bacterium]|nr:amylo-alpha-1,6-glucosidase [Acetobacteraceae bacterium]